MNSLKYFGTNTKDYGHYLWEFDSTGQYMYQDSSKLMPGFEAYGFKNKPKGTVSYRKENGYSILSITGSCKDTRPGTISVFYTEKELSREQMVQKIKMTPAAMKIIELMPFDVEGFNQVG